VSSAKFYSLVYVIYVYNKQQRSQDGEIMFCFQETNLEKELENLLDRRDVT